MPGAPKLVGSPEFLIKAQSRPRSDKTMPATREYLQRLCNNASRYLCDINSQVELRQNECRLCRTLARSMEVAWVAQGGRFKLADSSSITHTLRISCRDGVGGLVHQRGEHLVGCRKAKRLARPAVEPGRDRVEFGLREHRQVSAFG